ncbi:hypothetical protein, partial [Lentzea aerocolonigenes]|uniref:hypothetical protein n=1 Tax=Lentzea aerocolonigenes TaxID=68170 RepID=UPI001E5B946F
MRDQDHRLGVLLPHELHHGELAFGIATGGADQAQPALGRGLGLHALGHVRVVRRDHGVEH